nr:MAG TPA: hypothetical protein [Caudoviricetes sp.]
MWYNYENTENNSTKREVKNCPAVENRQKIQRRKD